MDKSYFLLFNEITDIISDLEALKEHLQSVQQKAEELYISDEEKPSF